jgi:hypothetical protein
MGGCFLLTQGRLSMLTLGGQCCGYKDLSVIFASRISSTEFYDLLLLVHNGLHLLAC